MTSGGRLPAPEYDDVLAAVHRFRQEADDLDVFGVSPPEVLLGMRSKLIPAGKAPSWEISAALPSRLEEAVEVELVVHAETEGGGRNDAGPEPARRRSRQATYRNNISHRLLARWLRRTS